MHPPGRVDGSTRRDQGLAGDLATKDALRPDRRADSLEAVFIELT